MKKPDPDGVNARDVAAYQRGERILRERAANRPILNPKGPTPIVSPRDFSVRNEGTLVMIALHSDAAKSWWAEHVQDCQSFGGAYAVEHRYAGNIIQGMLDAGLTAPQTLTV